jgi:Protein of unknown function (DUF2975)
MGVVEISVREARQSWFRRLDLAFWAIWAALPVVVWLAYLRSTTASASIAASLGPDPGQLLFWTLFALQLSFFAVLIGILHRMVHRFARGRIFASETLQGVWWMGIILVIWPFIDLITSNAVAYALHEIGDVKFFLPSYNVDIGTIAGGMFLMALKFVIEHAILLQSENELTI